MSLTHSRTRWYPVARTRSIPERFGMYIPYVGSYGKISTTSRIVRIVPIFLLLFLLFTVVVESPSSAEPGPVLASNTRPLPRNSLDEANRLVAKDQQIAAIQILEGIRKLHPQDIESRELLVKLFQWNDRADEIGVVLEELVELQPGNQERARELAEYYVAHNAAKKSIPIYERLAAHRRSDPAHKPAELLELLETLTELYGWEGDEEGSIRTLERWNQLEPSNDEVAEKLANLYEWNGRGTKAVVFLEQVVEGPRSTPELRFRLAQQLADAGRNDEAKEHVAQVVRDKPEDLKARFLLAQICHWSPCWPVAETQYTAILQRDPAHAEARRYSSLLRSTNGTQWRTEPDVFSDSNNVLRLSMQSMVSVAAGGRIRLWGQVRHTRLTQDLLGVGALNANQESAAVGITTALRSWLSVDAGLGADHIVGGMTSPSARVTARGAFRDRYFPSLELRREAHIDGVRSVKANIRRWQLEASMYSEPAPWVQFGVSARAAKLSDGNTRYVGYAYLGGVARMGAFQVKPGLALGYDDYATILVESNPYFTADQIRIVAPRIDCLYRPTATFELAAGYAYAFSPSGRVHNPELSLKWSLTPFDVISALYQNSGSREYSSQQGTAAYEHRF